MREGKQTSIHLLLATIVTVVGTILILITLVIPWEFWMIPIILVGNSLVWFLHVGRLGSEQFYQNLCTGLLMVGFFFFGVHSNSLFDIPAVACMMILVFSMFDTKRLLFMTAVLYVVELMYHWLVLGTITPDMEDTEVVRLVLGVCVTVGAISIARYRINRRLETRRDFDKTLRELETAGRQNAVFLSNVSHELRTPINMVIGISEVVLEKEKSPEIKKDMLSVQLAGKRMSTLINNMLDYTEIVEGTLTPSMHEYMITSVLNDVITMSVMQGGSSPLEMVFDIDPKVPAVMMGDSEKITHVLKIIVENSIKFTEEGGINVCVGCRKESYGVNLTIDIYDTGIGMTDSQMNQMFDDFYQADTGSSRLASGLGLGIPIARGLLHAMGGFIHFESKDRQGLEAHIAIPQVVVDDSPAVSLDNPEKLCIACYFRPERFSCDEVRGYYDKLIYHLVDGLGIEGYQAHNFEGLLKLLDTHPLTHVFIAQTEYEGNMDYYEGLSQKLRVGVIVDRDYEPKKNSRLMIIRKPFFALSIANLLNGEADENEFEEAQAAGRKPFSCKGVRVLAVDDEEMNLVVAKGVLGSYGIQVDTCQSGKEALERCGNTPYHMIFLDHMMPGFDGVETLRRIREMNGGMYEDLPVVALTANTISGAREMFRNEGFTEFIPKPIERTVLERVLRKSLPEECIEYNPTPSPAEKMRQGTEDVKEIPEIQNEPESVESLSEASQSELSEMTPEELKAGQELAEMLLGMINKETGHEEPEPEEVRLEETEIEPEPEEVRLEETEIEPDPEEIQLEETEIEPEPEEVQLEETETEPEPEEIQLEETETEPEPEEVRLEETEIEPELEEIQLEETETEPELEAIEPEEDEEFPRFAPLKQAGLNVKLGMDYCCGEEDFYKEMLDTFQKHSREKEVELLTLYKTGNWEDYIIKVHALKSTSLTIGAEGLSELARAIEQAGKAGNMDFVHRNHLKLLLLYEEVCKSIAKLE
jgi:signal transduction histidine kinase/CheY-like chemotaxis protein/HPt (histidine-containing phosphotransfer) domain-containing protein